MSCRAYLIKIVRLDSAARFPNDPQHEATIRPLTVLAKPVNVGLGRAYAFGKSRFRKAVLFQVAVKGHARFMQSLFFRVNTQKI